MIGMTAYLSDQRDALQAQLDTAVRDGQKATVALEQVRLYIQDALLCDDDLGLIRDVLHQALDVGRDAS